MTLLLEDLALITAKTLEHYNEHAAEFWEGTRDHDVKQNIEALLRHIRGAPPLRILDLGCGPGRDLAAFRALGVESQQVVPIDTQAADGWPTGQS